MSRRSGRRACLCRSWRSDQSGHPRKAKALRWSECDYEINGPATKHKGSFGGVDAVQALLNVVYALSVEAEMSEENQTGKLSWGGQKTHFGFPAPEADPERRG